MNSNPFYPFPHHTQRRHLKLPWAVFLYQPGSIWCPGSCVEFSEPELDIGLGKSTKANKECATQPNTVATHLLCRHSGSRDGGGGLTESLRLARITMGDPVSIKSKGAGKMA